MAALTKVPLTNAAETCSCDAVDTLRAYDRDDYGYVDDADRGKYKVARIDSFDSHHHCDNCAADHGNEVGVAVVSKCEDDVDTASHCERRRHYTHRTHILSQSAVPPFLEV